MVSRNLSAIAPLAPSQLGMLIQALGSPEPGVHVEQLSWPLPGLVRPDLMDAAWSVVVNGCEALRTGFILRDEAEPLQFVMRSASPELELVDLTGLAPGEQPPALQAFRAEQRAQGFELDRPPLLRLALVRCGPDLHHFVWTFHHIILDGWSVPLLAQRAFSVYEAMVRGETPGAWESRPYREFVAWLAAQPGADLRAFWRERLSSARLPTPLGSADASRAAPEGHGVHEVRLDATALAALERRAREQRVTLSTLLQGAWALLLAHYSGVDEVVFGATVSGRPPQLRGVETMVGLFINTIPIGVRVPPDGELWAWLAEQQERRTEEQHFAHCSTAQIHEWLELPGTTPLFESVLVFENYPIPSPGGHEPGTPAGLPAVRSDGSQTHFPLVVIVTPGDGLEIRLANRRRTLEDADAELVAAGLRGLLSELAARPDAELAPLRAWISKQPRPRYHATPAPARTSVAPPPAGGRVQELQSLWQELLGTGCPPDVDASFFDLGGQSLLALRLTREIRARLGVALALNQVFETPTIRGQAALLAGGAEGQAGITPELPPLITLLRPGAGTQPLFLAPPGAGTPVCYRALATAIAGEEAVYGFQTPGLNEGEQPLRSVAALGECMVSAIRRVQPRGPYSLGGWSFGAMLAWQAASLLQADGEEVQALILIDAGVQDERGGKPVLRRAIEDVATLAAIARQVGLPRSWERMRLLAQLVGIGLPESPLKIGRSELAASRRSFAAWHANTKAGLGHEPGRFDGEAVLIRGAESCPSLQDPLQARLSELTGGRVRVRSVSGNHMTLMLDPSNAEKLGVAVSEALKPT